MSTRSRWRHHVWVGERVYPSEQAARLASAAGEPAAPALLVRAVLALAALVAAASGLAWAL